MRALGIILNSGTLGSISPSATLVRTGMLWDRDALLLRTGIARRGERRGERREARGERREVRGERREEREERREEGGERKERAWLVGTRMPSSTETRPCFASSAHTDMSWA
eukprot:3548366-Rhodomonas_salina.2